MKIIRAEHLGMCFGVRDAIALALKQSQTRPLTVLGDLVHNDTVLSELRAKGIKIAQQVGAVQTQEVMITAHGASEQALIRRRFPNSDVRFIDTVCRPTKGRKNAAIELAQQCDVVVVIGGAHSNNTRELVKTCSRFCRRVRHVQTANDLQPEWFVDAETVGITAGTSTPDSTIDEVEGRLMEFGQDSFQSEPNSVYRTA